MTFVTVHRRRPSPPVKPPKPPPPRTGGQPLRAQQARRRRRRAIQSAGAQAVQAQQVAIDREKRENSSPDDCFRGGCLVQIKSPNDQKFLVVALPAHTYGDLPVSSRLVSSVWRRAGTSCRLRPLAALSRRHPLARWHSTALQAAQSMSLRCVFAPPSGASFRACTI